ncbi:unnamed protein product [Plutella xylostella]|uniref:(diamondback moth) hypothetical protein n=1 Tax=Plutella xylostella TaxID=51655 RepID=A0A8S4F9W3_PLUXY|nr:unnamed protein product [Plutella xylostella]
MTEKMSSEIININFKFTATNFKNKMMKLLVAFTVIGACVAYPSEPNQAPQAIPKPFAGQSNSDLPSLPPTFIPGGPHRPAEGSNGHLQGPIPVGPAGQAQPTVGPGGPPAPPQGDDLKTDSSFWRSYYYGGYPSWYSTYYSSPRYYSSYYSPYTYRSYYPSTYYWY